MSGHAAIIAVDRELPRTESLSVMLPFRRNVQQSSGTSLNLHQSAPQTLKNLSLSATGLTVQQTWAIFGGQWSHLRGLQITQVNLDWGGCQLSRLERLEITRTTSTFPSLAQLLHVLGCCPDLQYARLLNVGLEHGTDPPSGVITLPKLTTLILSCPTRSVTQLLLKARLPSCQQFEFQEDILWTTEPAYPSNVLDALMSIVDERSVKTDPKNTILYFPIQKQLVIQCHLESPASVTGLQFNLHLKNIGLGKELDAFKESGLWRVLEYGGLIIKEFDLKYGARVARHWPSTATSW